MDGKVQKAGVRLMLLKSKGNERLFNLKIVENDGQGNVKYINVTGPKDEQMLGWVADSGHISLFESDPNRKSGANSTMSMAQALQSLK